MAEVAVEIDIARRVSMHPTRTTSALLSRPALGAGAQARSEVVILTTPPLLFALLSARVGSRARSYLVTPESKADVDLELTSATRLLSLLFDRVAFGGAQRARS